MGATLASIDPTASPAINPRYPEAPEWGANFDRVVTAWCGAAYNEAADEMWLGMGGGHADYAGNEVMACNFWSEAPAWRMVRNPSGAIGNVLRTNDGQERTGLYADGRPRAIHGAGKWCYVPGAGPALMLLGGGSWNPAAGGRKWSIFIEEATGEAQFTVEAEPRVLSNLDNSGTCYDPSRHAIWISSRNSSVMLRYNIPASGGAHTGTYTSVGGVMSNQGNQNLCYLPGHDCILVGDSTDDDTLSRFRVVDCATGAVHAPAFHGALTGPIAAGAGQLRWVPSLRAACFWDNATQTTLIAKVTPGANPRTDAWTISTLPVAAANSVVPTARTARGTYGRFAYSPRLGGFLVFNSITGPTYFYKL
jgi:hypothetical protein